MDEKTAGEIRKQLDAIINSQDFIASKRLKEMLAFIVEKTLGGEEYLLKAYTIAVDVFGMDDNFDPRLNPLIRIEAARLRSKLEHFYLLNTEAKIYISIPKGSYVAQFSERTANHAPPEQTASNSLGASFTPNKQSYLSSILLLPFSNISGNGKVNCFISGLCNELNNVLTKFRELKIINGTSYLIDASTPGEVRGIAKKSKARFVLTGSVHLEDDIYNVWVSLIDSSTNYNMWAEKFTGAQEEAKNFTLQENIAEAIIHNISDDFGLINRTLMDECNMEDSGSSITQQAYLFYWRWATLLTAEAFESALQSVEAAAASEPNHIPTQALLADLYASDWEGSYNLIPNSLERSLQIATNAVNADPNCQLAHLAMALNHFLRNDKENFCNAATRTLKLNPQSGNALASLASWYGCLGFWDEALSITEKLIELNPASPGWCHFTLALYHYVHGDCKTSLLEAQKINSPAVIWDPLMRLLNKVRLDSEAAETAKQDLLAFAPNLTKNNWEILRRYMPLPEHQEMMISDLQKAGLK